MIDDLPDVSFHDSEVITVRFDRDGPRIEFDVAVVFPEPRMWVVALEEVSEVELGGLNDKNVLFDLKFGRGSDGLVDVELQSTDGIGGSVRCASFTVVPTLREPGQILDRDALRHFHLCEWLERLADEPPSIVYWSATRELLILYPDSMSAQHCVFCPGCGSQLPCSLRSTRLHIVEDEIGTFLDADDLPDEFRSDEWWITRGL